MVARGAVTLLFTDIEGSTRLWEDRPDWMSDALSRHDALVRQAIESHHGHVFKTVGDAFCAAFERAGDALATAEEIQRALVGDSWKAEPLKVRIAINAGNCEIRDSDYFGPPLNRTARILSLACGGQVLISNSAKGLVSSPDWDLLDLGYHRLRDLREPERLWQLQSEGLVNEFPPIASLELGKTNLPVEATNFVGRQREIGDLSNLLETSRLTTIHGPGGCGKTRLAIHVGAERSSEFPDGIWLAELAPVSDQNLVANVVAAAMGMSQTAGVPMRDGLVERLRGKNLLLILDNCEHVIGGCVELVSALLNSCPGVKILATSRQLLGVRAEQAFRIQPLGLPEVEVKAEDLERYEATALFMDRARLTTAGFQPKDDQAASIARICVRLDGIPYAIELAAARLRHLSVDQLETRLEDRFRLISAPGTDLEPRMRTLRAMIDWSYQLLSETEQRMFERLSVFAGGWTIELAEKLTKCDALADAFALDVVASLVDKSLVAFNDESGSGRYSMLESVRQFAAEKLDAQGDSAEARQRLLETMLELVEFSAPKLEGDPDQEICFRYLEGELDNMRAALDVALLTNKVSALRLATAAAPFWLVRGTYEEGLRWLDGLLLSNDIEDSELRTYGFSAAAMLALYHAEFKRAESLAESAMSESRSADSDGAKLRALVSMVWVVAESGDREKTEGLIQEALELARRLGSTWGLCMLVPVHGQMLVGFSDYVGAKKAFTEGLNLADQMCNGSMSCLGHYHLAGLAIIEQNWEAGKRHAEESIRIAKKAHDHSGIAHGTEMLARAQTKARTKEAGSLVRQAGKLLIEGGEQACLSHNLEAYARIALATGDEALAAKLLGCSDAILERLEMRLLPIEEALKEQIYRPLRERFADFELHRRVGAQMDSASALALAESACD